MQLDSHLLPKIVASIDSVIHKLGENTVSSFRAERLNTAKKRKIGAITKTYKQQNSNSFGGRDGLTKKDLVLDNSPPPGLDQQYRELYKLLRSGLLGINGASQKRCEGDEKRNVSALLMGPRGHGKSLVLDRVIAKLHQESKEESSNESCFTSFPKCEGNSMEKNTNTNTNSRLCRIVRLNGTLLRGHDVVLAVREIVRQLSEIAAKEAFQRIRDAAKRNEQQTLFSKNSTGTEQEGTSCNSVHDHDIKNYTESDALLKLLQKDSYALRRRQTSFNSSLALLDEVLQTALVDSIPILIVLEELDTFLAYSSTTSSNSMTNMSRQHQHGGNLAAPPTERHLLLYHLLDRVAGHGSLLSLVGMTSRLSTVSLFEKRVKSRAEGTSKVIYFGHIPSFDVLVKVILSKFDIVEEDEEDKYVNDDAGEKNNEDVGFDFIGRLKSELKQILLPPKGHIEDFEINSMTSQADKMKFQALQVNYMFQRSYSLGFDNRWFMRIISIALSLFVDDLLRLDSNVGEKMTHNIIFEPKYLIEGLKIMGVTKAADQLVRKSRSVSERVENGLKSSSLSSMDDDLISHSNRNFYYGAFNGSGQRVSTVGWDSARLQSLLDLPGPQVVILLAAKRILSREAHKKDLDSRTPLTYSRIQSEYESYKASGLDRYEEPILYRSLCQLMEIDLIRPVRDHTGGGPFQYYYRSQNRPIGLNPMTLKILPLYVNVDINEELGEALKTNMLDCTTALRDWGLKIN